MQTNPLRFRPRLIPTIATLLLLPALISLGQWQAHKAEKKQALQETYDQREQGLSLQVGAHPLNPEAVRYSRVVIRGRYEPAYQILLDNQVHDEMAGYHVLTPLHIEGGDMRVLVNRGWVAVGRDRNVLPEAGVPQGVVEISGYAVVPSGKFFELGKPEDLRSGWQKVWQNLDLKRYAGAVPFPLQPVVIRLDPASTVGGYIREWPRPDDRIGVHRGYALQWYGMAAVLVVFYLVTSCRRSVNDDHDHA